MAKKKYIVYTREVYQQPVHIEAESEKEAIAKVEEGEGIAKEEELDYSYTLDSDEWHVEEVKD